MLRLLLWLRELDARLLMASAGSKAGPEPTGSAWAPHVAALGGVLVLLAALLLQSHEVLQLVVVSAGLLLTAPWLQDGLDRASAWSRE